MNGLQESLKSTSAQSVTVLTGIKNGELKEIPGYETRYKIDLCGNVLSCRRGGYLVHRIYCGYNKVCLYDGNRHKLIKVARLIALIFIDNPNNYPIINHIDGNKLNDNINNIEWCTPSHNNTHAYRLGLNGGEKHALSKLTSANVREIKVKLKGNFGVNSIAREYGVSSNAISAIKRGITWKYIGI